jgi:predicted RNase H-like HicB family nuclease
MKPKNQEVGSKKTKFDLLFISCIIKVMKRITLQNIVWKEGKNFVAQSISPDVSSFGKTKKEALKNLAEALELYFEDAPKNSVSPIKSLQIEKQVFCYA